MVPCPRPPPLAVPGRTVFAEGVVVGTALALGASAGERPGTDEVAEGAGATNVVAGPRLARSVNQSAPSTPKARNTNAPPITTKRLGPDRGRGPMGLSARYGAMPGGTTGTRDSGAFAGDSGPVVADETNETNDGDETDDGANAALGHDNGGASSVPSPERWGCSEDRASGER